jgi:hypothetical protein
VLRHLDDGHKPTQVVNIKRQAVGDPQIRMKQFQIFDADPMAVGTKQLAILAGKPHLGACQVQIAIRAMHTTVDTGSLLTATLTNRIKAHVGLSLNASLAGIG